MSADSTCSLVTLCTSTVGASPVTVTSSAMVPTRSCASTRVTDDPVSSIPSRTMVEKPVSVNATRYCPGRRSTIWKRPLPSVTAVRTFSMSTGLDASTVTPGSTAPDVSCTTPVTVACADAMAGSRSSHESTNMTAVNRRIANSPLGPRQGTASVFLAGHSVPVLQKRDGDEQNPADLKVRLYVWTACRSASTFAPLHFDRDGLRSCRADLARRGFTEENGHDDAEEHAGHRDPQDVLDAVALRHRAGNDRSHAAAEDF